MRRGGERVACWGQRGGKKECWRTPCEPFEETQTQYHHRRYRCCGRQWWRRQSRHRREGRPPFQREIVALQVPKTLYLLANRGSYAFLGGHPRLRPGNAPTIFVKRSGEKEGKD